MGQGGLSKKAQQVQEDSRCKGIQRITSKEEIKCVCLNLTYLLDLKLLLVIQRRGHTTKNGSPVDAMLGDTNCLCEGEVDDCEVLRYAVQPPSSWTAPWSRPADSARGEVVPFQDFTFGWHTMQVTELLNARSIINKKDELNIMVDDIKPHIIGITESWANNDIKDAELGLDGYAMFRKDRMGRRGGGVLLYINDTIPAYEVQLQEEADCNEAIWCKLVTGHTTVTIGVVYRCPNITKQNNEKIHNAISEVSKGDCIIMGDFNHGNIKWYSL